MDREVWTVAEAKAKFSEVIERAMSLGPRPSLERVAPLRSWLGQRSGNGRQSASETWQNFLPHPLCGART
jgi:hypothetical protein